jgi:hypothetical protein
MTDFREWDLSTPSSPAKSIHLPPVDYYDTDQCGDEYTDGWGVPRWCDRLPGHTGRHRANERLGRYPVAVWS